MGHGVPRSWSVLLVVVVLVMATLAASQAQAAVNPTVAVNRPYSRPESPPDSGYPSAGSQWTGFRRGPSAAGSLGRRHNACRRRDVGPAPWAPDNDTRL